MPDYLTVTCRLPAAAEPHLAGALERWPVLGCQVEDAGVDVDVTVFLDEVQAPSLPTVLEGLRALGARDLGAGHFAEEDWLSEYRRCVAPRAVGSRLWIDPHPAAPTPAPPGRIRLAIEPRQAFGTGSHESTQVVLLLLEELELSGVRVLDVGAGSGILALTARAYGAASAIGFDIDLDAVFVAHQTVAVQAPPLAVPLYAGAVDALRPGPRFDLILANMIPVQFEPLLEQLGALLAPGGRLLLSGLMADQRAAVAAELDRAGFAITGERALGEWVALVCRPIAARLSILR